MNWFRNLIANLSAAQDRANQEERGELSVLAAHAGSVVGGAWSVDILETERGWMVTDMAEAHKSFHWEGCPHAGS